MNGWEKIKPLQPGQLAALCARPKLIGIDYGKEPAYTTNTIAEPPKVPTIELNRPTSDPPVKKIPATRASDMAPTMIAYSIAVAPSSFFT